MTPCCETCHHWREFTAEDRAESVFGAAGDGVCSARPPSAVFVEDLGRTVLAVFPPTDRAMRCGAWTPRAVPPPDPAPSEPGD